MLTANGGSPSLSQIAPQRAQRSDHHRTKRPRHLEAPVHRPRVGPWPDRARFAIAVDQDAPAGFNAIIVQVRAHESRIALVPARIDDTS